MIMNSFVKLRGCCFSLTAKNMKEHGEEKEEDNA
jgi:hypothetical protein